MKKITIAVNSEDIDYLSSMNVYNIKVDKKTLLRAIDIDKYIAREINQANKDGQPTSRLTSLLNKLYES